MGIKWGLQLLKTKWPICVKFNFGSAKVDFSWRIDSSDIKPATNFAYAVSWNQTRAEVRLDDALTPAEDEAVPQLDGGEGEAGLHLQEQVQS